MPATHPEDIERDDESFNLTLDGRPFELPVAVYRSMRNMEKVNAAGFSMAYPAAMPVRQAYDAVKEWKAEQGHGRGGAKLDLGRVIGSGSPRATTIAPALAAGHHQGIVMDQPFAATHGSVAAGAAGSQTITIEPESDCVIKRVFIATDDADLLLTEVKVLNTTIFTPSTTGSAEGYPVADLTADKFGVPQIGKGWTIGPKKQLKLTVEFSAAGNAWVTVETTPTVSTDCARS